MNSKNTHTQKRVFEKPAHSSLQFIRFVSFLSLGRRFPIQIMIASDVVVGIVANVLSSVGLVLINKYLFARLHYEYMVVLSGYHFIFTWLSCTVMMRMGVFQYKPAPVKSVLPLCIGSVGSVAFMNLNLAYNSVGFYQLSKLLCIPATLFIQAYYFNKSTSTAVKQSLVFILLGVCIATVTDIELNFVGSVFAFVAVISTTLAQIYTNTKQSELGLDAMQLLYHASPYTGMGMFLLAPLLENITGPKGLLSYQHSVVSVSTVLLTCILAVAVNASNYFVIGRTSPVTYQVVGHLKTCLILVLGFVVFHYQPYLYNIVGIVIAVGGMVLYTEIKRREQMSPASASAAATNSNSVSSVYSALASKSSQNHDDDVELGEEDDDDME